MTDNNDAIYAGQMIVVALAFGTLLLVGLAIVVSLV